ncbi:MAG: chromate transporter [Clostridia bacterium]|nr:chromate transporter [Clostridia bacterium]
MLFELFKTFFLIGAFSFGGGYGMLPLIQQEVVISHQWLTMHQFSDILAIAEVTPGPVAINTATFVGYKMAGVFGSAAATLGVIVPSFIIILCLAGVVLRNKDNKYFQSAFMGLRPVVVALVVGAALLIGRDTLAGWKDLIMLGAGLLIMLKTNWHPVLVVLLFGVLGIFIF